ncbi:alpha/beta fold hydrolase [Nitrososphaera sp.]|uniref:alpha/beta hydrolase n=1 Tax=Nitrososphaera sp. TaxID=1971748 RepID=UPI0031757C51
MQEQRGSTHIQTSLGEINLLHFPPEKSSGKTLLCIHGAYCDSRIFNYLGSKLSAHDIEVYSMDLPGHGKSAGVRGDLDFERALSAINEVIQSIKKDSEIYILGHSLGCTFALWFAHNFKDAVNGLVLMAPYVRITNIKERSPAEPKPMEFLFLLLSRIFTPGRLVNIADAVPMIRKLGGKEVEEMLKDPEINFQYSYRFIVDIIAARNSKVKELSDIAVPVLLLHGRNDKHVYSVISEEFQKLIKAKDKKAVFFDCDHWFFRSIFYNQDDPRYSEKDRIAVMDTIADWLTNRPAKHN